MSKVLAASGEVKGWPKKFVRAWKTKDEIHKRNRRLGLIRPARKQRD